MCADMMPQLCTTQLQCDRNWEQEASRSVALNRWAIAHQWHTVAIRVSHCFVSNTRENGNLQNVDLEQKIRCFLRLEMQKFIFEKIDQYQKKVFFFDWNLKLEKWART